MLSWDRAYATYPIEPDRHDRQIKNNVFSAIDKTTNVRVCCSSLRISSLHLFHLFVGTYVRLNCQFLKPKERAYLKSQCWPYNEWLTTRWNRCLVVLVWLFSCSFAWLISQSDSARSSFQKQPICDVINDGHLTLMNSEIRTGPNSITFVL